MEFFNVCSLDELKKEKRRIIDIKNSKIALFYLEGQVYAINAVCPHKGGPLGEGEIEDEEVICPWHGFMFNIKNGGCLNHSGYSVRTFPVKVVANKVKVGIA